MREQHKVAHVLSTIGPTLRKLAGERDQLIEELEDLKEKLSHYEVEDRVLKIAEALGDKTGFSGTPFSERVAYVKKRASADDASLDVLEEAAHLMAKEGSLGSLADKTASGDSQAVFEALLMGALP